MPITYRLRCPGEPGDDTPSTYISTMPVLPGMVIYPPPGSLWYVVYEVTQQKTGPRLLLSRSAGSREDALLLAEQKGDWPPRRA